MGVDRASAVKKAEALVREGKIDLAIAEYVRLVDEQPGDVSAANALGDLYAKVGNRAAAVERFVAIGDSHRDSGFVPKAVAFYKKALKVDPASDHALTQLAQIAVDQELYADATLYLNRLLQRRRDQNDEAGVAECLVRLGGFPTATADAKMAAARASATHFAGDQTARLWLDAADALQRAGRSRDAVDVLMQAASLMPDDVPLRRRVAEACAATGQIDRARAFLSFETAGDHPDLLLALAEHALADGRDDDARRALEHAKAVAPARADEADAMLAPLIRDDAPAPPPSPHESTADVFAVEAGEPIDVAAAFGSAGDDAVAQFDAELEWSAVLGKAKEEPEETVVAKEADEDAVYVVPEPEPEPEAVASEADLDSIAALTAAAQNAAIQFQASAQLGRLLLRLGRVREGIDWLERATQATTSVREQRLDVMYELADALERAGERARALDVFSDLDFDAASFRDVPERMAALRRALGEGRAT